MKSIFVIVLVIVSAYGFDMKDLRCLVCKATVKEMNKAVSEVSDQKTVDVGGYSLDPKGNVKTKKKTMIESEVFLSEVMDNICDKMSDYVRATYKSNGTLVLLNMTDLVTVGLGDVDIIQDGDLNRSLEHLCKGVLEEFEDEVLETFGKRSVSPVEDVCIRLSGLCGKEKTVRTDL